MHSIRRILVAIKDPESKSLPAVTKAAQLAQALGAELELFHGIATPLYVDPYIPSDIELPDLERETQARVTSLLEKIAARVRRHPIKVTVAAEWDYPVYEAIVRRAVRIKADLIVAERHVGRHFAAGILHLTDWELLRLSPVPVLLVKTAGVYRRPTVLAAVDPGHTYSKPAKLDNEILRAGSIVTRALRGTLHAVHAYIPLSAMVAMNGTISPDTADRLASQAAFDAQRGFDRVLRGTKINKSHRHLLARHPIDAIEQTARETGSAIVVMGAISRSGLKRLFIGNTAESVLDHLACDVLIVKPVRFASHVAPKRRGVRMVAVANMPVPF